MLNVDVAERKYERGKSRAPRGNDSNCILRMRSALENFNALRAPHYRALLLLFVRQIHTYRRIPDRNAGETEMMNQTAA